MYQLVIELWFGLGLLTYLLETHKQKQELCKTYSHLLYFTFVSLNVSFSTIICGAYYV